MACISDLPPELIIPIMHLCNTPHDLSALIQTSPHFLGIFLSNRSQITKPIINELESRFGGLVPRMCLLATHLRHVRSKRPVGSSTQDLERELESTKSACLKLPEAGIKLDQTHNLSLLCSLSTLLTEAEWVMRGYIPRVWDAEIEQTCLGFNEDRKKIYELRKKFILSKAVRQGVFHSIFCFESYCQMYFLGKEPLFEKTAESPLFFFESGTKRGGNSFKRTNAFHAIAQYVCEPYWILEREANGYIRSKGMSPNGLQKPCLVDGSDRTQLYLDRFHRGTNCEMKRFVHFMLSQGLGMFFKVEMLGRQDAITGQRNQFIFIAESFYNFITSFEPVPIVHGSNCHCQGRLEEDSPRLWDHAGGLRGLRLSDWPAGKSIMREHLAEREKWT